MSTRPRIILCVSVTPTAHGRTDHGGGKNNKKRRARVPASSTVPATDRDQSRYGGGRGSTTVRPRRTKRRVARRLRALRVFRWTATAATVNALSRYKELDDTAIGKGKERALYINNNNNHNNINTPLQTLPRVAKFFSCHRSLPVKS